MKICWENLDGLYLTRNGLFRKGNVSFVQKDSCKTCMQPYLTPPSRQSEYCSISCSKKDYVTSEETKEKLRKKLSGKKHPWYGKKHSYDSKLKMSNSSKGKKHKKETIMKMSNNRRGSSNNFYGRNHSEDTKLKISLKNKGVCSGSKNPSYKGGVSKYKIPLYDTYSEKISWCEDVRFTYFNGLKVLQVRCKNSGCGNWFIPTTVQIQNRIQSIKGNYGGSNFLYCSDECKKTCSIYNKPVTCFINSRYSNYELQVWAKEVLKRHNYKCEYCGKKANTAHHIIPKKLDQFYALDPDNGIACCEECHYKYGHKDECNTYNLSKITC